MVRLWRRGRFGVLVAVSLAAALAVSGMSSAVAAGTLDQKQESHPNFDTFQVGFKQAQTFTAGITGNLDQVDLFLISGPDPSPVTVEIQSTDGGTPTNTVLG